MRTVVSLRLKADQVQRLRRASRAVGKTPSETAAFLLGEALRRRDFPLIDFRDSPAGRQAYILGSRTAVWHVAKLAREFGGDSAAMAAFLEIPEVRVRAALAYAQSFPREIEAAIADNEWIEEHVLPLTPGSETLTVKMTGR
ncbi:MAG TPA: transcriptional regulator [Chloroflexota bacterium]|nr:transcriptional regulator [Chloroflexota bacterium]